MSLGKILVSALLAAGCGNADSPVTLGVILDAEGVATAELAAEHINAAGGVGGRPLRLRSLPGESGNMAPQALRAADSLAGDPRVLAVVGHTNSAASLAGAQVYNSRGVVQLAPTSTAPVYSEAGPWSFRLVASDLHQGRFLARAVAQGAGNRIAVFYVNDDYGRAIHQSFMRELAGLELSTVYEAAYLEGPRFSDRDVMTRAVIAARPDLLVWLGREPELRAVLPPLRRALPSLRVLSSDGFSTARLNQPGGDALLGVQYVRLVDPTIDSPVMRQIRDRARAVTGAEPTDQATLAYQAVQVLAHAIGAVGPDRERIREFLAETGSTRPAIQTVAGPVTFDSARNATPAYFLVEVRPGSDRATPAVRARAP